MAAIALLRDVVDGIESQSDESASYLNRRTGEVYFVTDEAHPGSFKP